MSSQQRLDDPASTQTLPWSTVSRDGAQRGANVEVGAATPGLAQPTLALPLDRPWLPATSVPRGALTGELGAALLADLTGLAAQVGGPVQTVLFAGCCLLLHRLATQPEITVFVAVERRRDGKAVSALLPVKSRLLPEVSAHDFLRSLAAALPSELRSLSRLSIRLHLCSPEMPEPDSPPDLRLTLSLSAGAALFQCVFREDLWNEPTVALWIECWRTLLSGLAHNPQAPVETVPLLSGTERQRMLEQWNSTERDWGPFVSIPQRFAKRTARTPARVAVQCGQSSWTCAQLSTFANGLAARLIASGTRPGDLVAIALPRSPELVGALLAVMLAGAAWLPLDPSHPRERLTAILEDAGAALLLTTKDVPFPDSVRVLYLDGTQPRSEPPPAAVLTPGSLAYVIYTSGSTGKPKGVAVEHGSLLNLLLSMAEAPGLTASDTLVALTTLSFDIAALEILLPLITGATLVVAGEDEPRSGMSLLRLIERTRATVVQGVPAHWRLLLDAGWNDAGPSDPSQSGTAALKCLCGGEPLPPDLAARILARGGELWNMYGPTETTVWSAVRRVSSAQDAARIGLPISNTQFHVLGPGLEPVPTGVVGELFIGGSGVARGYWKRPDLTSTRFVKDPFSGRPGDRLYATGDLARRNPDGTLDLLGRADFQLKLNGHRIEPGEIEAAIVSFPGVSESVVVLQRLHEDDESSDCLVAYLVPAAGTGDSHGLPSAVRSHLEASLPPWMVPSGWVVLDAMPRTGNGKLDRRALPRFQREPEPPAAPQQSVEEDEAPGEREDLIELQLADLWQNALGLAQVGYDTSFFEYGFNSLAAGRLITRVNRAFGLGLGIISLVSAPTIRAQAELVRTRFAPDRTSSIIPLRTQGSRPPLFLLHGLGGTVLLFYSLAGRMGSEQPVYAVQAQSLVGNEPGLLRLEDLAAYYLRDIRKIQPHGPYHLVGYSSGGTLALEMARQIQAAGEQVGLLGMLDSSPITSVHSAVGKTPVKTRVGRHFEQFRRNIRDLPWHSQAGYVLGKFYTRAVRFLCVAASHLRLRRVPAFLRSTYDINLVALNHYRVQPYDGRMVLFRAHEQLYPEAAEDLGWAPTFRGGVEVVHLPGNHEKIFLEPDIDTLAASLRQHLARSADAEPSTRSLTSSRSRA